MSFASSFANSFGKCLCRLKACNCTRPKKDLAVERPFILRILFNSSFSLLLPKNSCINQFKTVSDVADLVAARKTSWAFDALLEHNTLNFDIQVLTS